MSLLAPSGPPQNVSSVVISSTKIYLSWSPPLINQQNGLIQSYTITIYEIDTNTTIQQHQNVIYNTITLTNLHPNYQYVLSVAAYTVGLGPSSSVATQTLEDGVLNFVLINKIIYI